MWSAAEETHIRTRHAAGDTLAQILQTLPDRDRSSLEPKMRRMGLTQNEAKPNITEAEYIQSISHDTDEWPFSVRPVSLNVGYPATPPTQAAKFTSFHLSDTHFPFPCEATLTIMKAVMKDVGPQIVVHHGDLLDCYQVSRYEKNPRHRVSLQEEIEQAARLLAEISAIAPNAEKILIGGNHEDRLRRIIWDTANSNPQAGQLLQLPAVAEALEWPKLLGLESIGWQWSDKKRILFDRLICKHGNVVRKWSGYTAKAEWEKYAKSGMSGHTHRTGSFIHRDHNGSHGWWELGCTCNTDPDYTEDPDWQNSFAVVTWSDDRLSFAVEQVLVHRGSAMFRGRRYTA
jgi:predicted phosphodiesterase